MTIGIVHSAGPNGELYWPWAAPSRLNAYWAMGYFTLSAEVFLLSRMHPIDPAAAS